MRKNGENKTAVNGKAEDILNSENSGAAKRQETDTQPHASVNDTNPEPTDKQSSGIPEENA